MVDRRLVDYIKIGKKRGASEESLKRKLIEQGHSHLSVDEAIKEANKKSSVNSYLVIAGIFIALLFVFLILSSSNKIKTTTKPTIQEKKIEPVKQLTPNEQLDLINKALSEKYKDYKIKNFGDVIYTKDIVLRAEVDLGLIDVCNQKIKADSAVFVLQNGKIVSTPSIEIENKAKKFGNILSDIRKVDREISYDCENNKCSKCKLNNIYEIPVKLNTPYDKNDAKITHKKLLMDEVGNLIYSYEAIENNKAITFVGEDFARS